MQAPREYAYTQLVRVLEDLGHVNDHAKDLLEQAVDSVFDDPLNADYEEAERVEATARVWEWLDVHAADDAVTKSTYRDVQALYDALLNDQPHDEDLLEAVLADMDEYDTMNPKVEG